MAVTELADADFAGFTKDGVAVVDFWAPWCGPCKRMAPIFDQLSTEMRGVRFGKINTDEHRDVAAELGVMSIPTLMVYKDGQRVDSLIGAMPKEALEAKLSPLLA